MAINKLDPAATAPMFAKKAQLHNPKGTFHGVENIVAFLKSVEPMAKGNRHLTCDVVIDELEEGLARASSYRMLIKASTPSALLLSGTIEDKVVYEDGHWKFLERRFMIDPPAAGPAAADGPKP